jgi:hypothetical protein
MTTYTLNFAGSGAVSEILADSDTQAIQTAESILESHGYDSPAWADQWDADGANDDGVDMERLLCWATEEDSIDDPGVRAIAYLSAGAAR